MSCPDAGGPRPAGHRSEVTWRASTGGLVRVVLALLTLLALAGLAPAASASSPPGTATGTGAPRGALVVDVETLEPRAPRPGDVVTVSGRLSARDGQAVTGLRVTPRVGARLVSRSALAAAASRPPAPVRSTEAQVLPDLPAGGSAPFTVAVPVDELRLGDAPGVVPFRLDLTGRSAGGARRATVDTLLPWIPDPVTPARAAWVWPLVDRPHLGPDGELLDDDLVGALARGGRLDGLVEAARTAATAGTGSAAGVLPGAEPAAAYGERRRPVPVTWVVDPDLLATVERMATPYDVRTSAGPARGAGTAAAASLLERLRAATRGAALLSLPYADPDVVALVRAGLGDDVAAAATIGATTAAGLLPAAVPLRDVAWPPEGRLNAAGLDALAAAGTRTVVLAEQGLPLRSPTDLSRSAPARVPALGRELAALVADAGVAGLLAATPTGSPRLAEQRFLAETAMLVAERPGVARDVVVAPPRRWAPDPAYAAAVLADTGRVPWLEPTALTDLLTPDPLTRPAGAVPPARLDYTAADAAAELPVGYLDGVDRVRQAVTATTTLLVAPAGNEPLRRGLLRAESSAWRGRVGSGLVHRDAVQAVVDAQQAAVRVIPTGTFTLSSRSGRFLITIENGLDQDVDVQLRLDAASEARLDAETSGVQRVGARRRDSVEVSVTTQTTGSFPVYATLLTREGQQLGTRTELLVRSTAYGRVAVGITGGAGLLLVGALGVRIGRRALPRLRAPRPRAARRGSR